MFGRVTVELVALTLRNRLPLHPFYRYQTEIAQSFVEFPIYIRSAPNLVLHISNQCPRIDI